MEHLIDLPGTSRVEVKGHVVLTKLIQNTRLEITMGTRVHLQESRLEKYVSLSSKSKSLKMATKLQGLYYFFPV